jgi:hypothetical protein
MERPFSQLFQLFVLECRAVGPAIAFAFDAAIL